MYLKHFGFKRKPFVSVPDRRELFQTGAHQEIRARLQIAFDDRVGTLVDGEPGVGKSTSIRSALQELDDSCYRIIEIADPRLGLRGFYGTLARGLGLEARYFFADLSKQVREALARISERGRHPVLLIDEAQMLTNQNLHTLRILTNPLLDQKKAGLTLVLVGDRTLRRRLARPRFKAFLQRLRMIYRMPPISEEEGRRYIAHRIRIAGGDPDCIAPAAVEAVLAEADGRLRRIDEYCIQALYAAFIENEPTVGVAHVEAVRTDRYID